jgi:hypothetical protein
MGTIPLHVPSKIQYPISNIAPQAHIIAHRKKRAGCTEVQPAGESQSITKPPSQANAGDHRRSGGWTLVGQRRSKSFMHQVGARSTEHLTATGGKFQAP